MQCTSISSYTYVFVILSRIRTRINNNVVFLNLVLILIWALCVLVALGYLKLSFNANPLYWGVVWSKGTTNEGTGKSIWTYILRVGDLIVKFPQTKTKVTFGKGLIF